MNATYVLEKGISLLSTHEYEEDIARRWWDLPLNVTLPLTNGESYQLIYAGRQGGSTGPDIRDAIVSFSSFHSRSDFAAANNQTNKTIGDVEIHVRATRHRALPLDAPGTLLEKRLATERKPD